MMNVLSLQNVEYSYSADALKVLRGVTAEFERGKVYAVAGKSGSGKSTFLSLLAGLDTCKGGTILYNGTDLKTLDRDEYRAKSAGVIFQAYNLLLNLKALENIVLAMEISGVKADDKNTFAYSMLEKVGIDKETANRKVLKLSGGEQQRVCIARALSHDPDVILADEPTGNLDGENEKAVLDILQALAHNDNRCVIIVTHDQTVMDIADVVMRLADGKF
jgi:putative ABC transport system ATP-binding protein